MGCIILSHYAVDNYIETKRLNCFILVPQNPNNSRTWYFSAESKEEKEDWKEVLQDLIQGKKINKDTYNLDRQLRGDYIISVTDLKWSEDASSVLGKGLFFNERKKEYKSSQLHSLFFLGAAGIVRKGIWLTTTEVALKALNNLPEFITQEELAEFYKELAILRFFLSVSKKKKLKKFILKKK